MKITILRVEDSFGNDCEVVFQNDDSICVYGLQKEDGEYVQFENGAHHVYDWADGNGFDVRKYELDVNLENQKVDWKTSYVRATPVNCAHCGRTMVNGKCPYDT